MADTDSLTPYQQRRASGRMARFDEPAPRSHLDALPEKLRKERHAEINRRRAETRRRALLILTDRYPEEFAELMRTERAGVDAERGPVPGDHALDLAEALRVSEQGCAPGCPCGRIGTVG